MIRVIGIDFGTSSTYMSVKRYNPEDPAEDSFNYIPVSFEHGESKGSLISVIRENSDRSLDFGRVANEEADGAVVYSNFKMNLESPDDALREKSRYLVRELFKYLHRMYELQSNQLGEKDDEVETNISYPVKWQRSTADFMISAAKDAGFQNVSGIDEATAAVTTVLSRNFDNLALKKMISPETPGYILLIDMGAGTTDCALCRYSFEAGESGEIKANSLKVEIITCWPVSEDDPTFGGREIDQVLAGYIEDFLCRTVVPELKEYVSNLVRVGNNVKLWKENNVSANLNKNKPVTVCGFIKAYLGAAGVKFPAITRESFEKLIGDKLNDYVDLIRGCLEKAGAIDQEFKERGLDLVILAGGHSSWYFAKDIIDGTMPGYLEHSTLSRIREEKDRVFTLPNPQSTVVLGLIYRRLLSTITLKKSDKIDNSWVELLRTAAPNPEFFSELYGDGEDTAMYNIAKEFTMSYDFKAPPEAWFHISVGESNRRVYDIFCGKSFFAHKNKDICFCAEKNDGSLCGFTVSSFGIYYETLFSSRCISWETFLYSQIIYSGWNSDKISIGYTVLPVHRTCVPLCMEYLQGMQSYIRQKCTGAEPAYPYPLPAAVK